MVAWKLYLETLILANYIREGLWQGNPWLALVWEACWPLRWGWPPSSAQSLARCVPQLLPWMLSLPKFLSGLGGDVKRASQQANAWATRRPWWARGTVLWDIEMNVTHASFKGIQQLVSVEFGQLFLSALTNLIINCNMVFGVPHTSAGAGRLLVVGRIWHPCAGALQPQGISEVTMR